MIRKIYKTALTKLFWVIFRHFLTDRQYAKVRYWLEHDEYLDLQAPKKFTEKIQHLKLFERTKLRQTFANRIAVREYVKKQAGAKYLIPLIGNYQELTLDIWQALPSQFVLKANHGCGMLRIIQDKEQVDFKEVKQQTEQWKQTDYAKFGREWAYEGLPRTIVAEKLLLDNDHTIPKDYKFFCFNGHVELIQIDFDRFGDQRRNLYDRNFNRLPAKLLYPHYSGPVQKPENLSKAIQLAETLSSSLNFVRVDLYLLDDHIYVGELTNYPGNGFVPFEPEEMEYKMGALLELH